MIYIIALREPKGELRTLKKLERFWSHFSSSFLLDFVRGGYLVWLWLREDMSWILGAIGVFILFPYGIVPTFQPSYFHRIYAAYGGIFIVMALLWGLAFEGIIPDMFDIIGAVVACAGVTSLKVQRFGSGIDTRYHILAA